MVNRPNPRRLRIPLPRFAPRCNADPIRAWNDRIKLHFGSGSVRVGENANLVSHLRSVAALGKFTQPNQARTNPEVRLRDDFSYFGAKIKFYRTGHRERTSIGNALLWNMKIDLEINPLRLFSHFGCRITTLRGLQRGALPSFDETRDLEIRNETLDGNSNHILDDDIRRAVNADRYQVNRLAIRCAISFLARNLAPIGNIAGLGSVGREGIAFDFNWDHWAIRQLETCWEYSVADAVSTVHSIARQSSEIASGLRETFYALDDIEVRSPSLGRPQNAVELTVPLGQKNTKLAIYAKSPRRVRCEVRYLKNPRSIYNRSSTIRELTTDRLENLFDALIEINRLSADNRANPFLAELWRHETRPVGTVVQLTLLLQQIAEACHVADADMLRVLSPLIAHGRLHGNGDDAYKAAVRGLVDRGVLVPTKNRSRAQGRVYAITRPYADALERVKGNIRRL